MNLNPPYGSSVTICPVRIVPTLPSLATPATTLFITTAIGSTMAIGTGILGPGPPTPLSLPVTGIVAPNLVSATRGFLVTGKPSARTVVIAGGYEFLVIEDSAFRRTLLAIGSLALAADDAMQTDPTHGVKTPNCAGDNVSTSLGSIYVQPPFPVGSSKCTCPFIYAGVAALFRSFLVSMAQRTMNYMPPQHTNVFHYPNHCTSSLDSCPIHSISLSPHLPFHNLIHLLQSSIKNRLFQSPRIVPGPKPRPCSNACPSCSALDISTTSRHTPFFAESFRDISLFDFDSTVILPFKKLAWGDKPAHTSHVGLSSVSKICIHPAHHNFHESMKNIFALKKLHSDRIEDFKREARALQAFAVSPHEHIVRLLAAFRHAGSFYLLFPWASGGSLRSFWRAHPQPSINHEVSSWVAKQSLGIAAALHKVHREPKAEKEGNHDYGQQYTSTKVRGYHGDIKPENILLFGGDRQGSCHVWKIGDFGVSNRFLVATRGGDIPKGFTPTYQSPEHQVEGRIDDCADVWSLGCVLLETVIWMLRGWDGLVHFGFMRQTPNHVNGQNNIKNDTFFDMVSSTINTVPVPVLKPSIIQCIESLSCDPNVTPYLRDLLHLIRHYLLDVNKHSRLSSELLVKVLRQLHQRCLDIPAYTVAMPRPQKPPLHTRFVHYETNNSCIADLSTPGNPLTSKATPRMFLTYMASSRNTTLQTNSYGDPAMALDSGHAGVLTSSQWLDDFIRQQQYNIQTGFDSTTQESLDDIFKPNISEDTQLPSTNVMAQPGRRRRFSSITDRDEEDCYRRTKYQKRGETLQRNLGTNPHLVDAYPSNALNIPQPASPLTPASQPRLFACPFSKRLGDKYLTTKDWKCCLGPGPGWTIHRLKEHLYRKHASPNYQCPRCLVEFEDISNLHQHQRSATSCLVHADTRSRIERIDAQQMIQIKKKYRRRSDETKWNDIYRIIFRLDQTADLPSPYYEDIASVSNVESSPYCAGDFPLPISEAPSLVFDSNSTLSTIPYEYPPSTSTTLSTTGEYNPKTCSNFDGMGTDNLAEIDLWESSFQTRFHQVFGPVIPEASTKPVSNPRNFQHREGLG
ncbi:kinase-like domain-containing protein [Xylaria cf. heliscus]|nr:kinase-like domain-containing protein [Xylaria cf. heliscus]